MTLILFLEYISARKRIIQCQLETSNHQVVINITTNYLKSNINNKYSTEAKIIHSEGIDFDQIIYTLCRLICIDELELDSTQIKSNDTRLFL